MEHIIADIIIREGGYVDHPDDKGGPTKYGITQASLSEWRDKPQTPAHVAALTVEQAHEFYRWYFKKLDISGLPPEVIPQVLDMLTLHGPSGTKRLLQSMADYWDRPHRDQFFHDMVATFGPETTNALITLRRIKLFRSLANRNRSQRAFLLGWLNRMKEFEPKW